MADPRAEKLNRSWYASLPASGAEGLGALRQLSGIEVLAAAPDALWLRGSAIEPGLMKALRSISGLRLYRGLGDGRLSPWEAEVPVASAPEPEDWLRLDRWLQVVPCPAKLAARPEERIALRLDRSDSVEPPRLVRTTLRQWTAYAATAPLARLSPLRFAANGEEAFVLGEPLPPIPGQHFYVIDGIAAPVGYGWKPAVGAATVREVFGLEGDDLALFLPEGGSCVVRSLDWVAASRSAARLTEEAVRAGN